MIGLLLLLAANPSTYRERDLRDEDLVRLQEAPVDKNFLENTRVLLGRYHGTPVVADFPCSDLCPAYTTRIIHFDVEPGADCTALGGIERSAMVPMGVAVHRETFCVPKVLGSALIREGS